MSEASSTVSWTDHHAYVLNGLRSAFTTGKYSDLEIHCDDRIFRVHKVILGFFTDFFKYSDGVYVKLECNVKFLEKALKFVYDGQVMVEYEEMEGFLNTCKYLNLKLFKPLDWNAEGIREDQIANFYRERYELNDFQLMCHTCYKCFPDEKSLKKHNTYCSDSWMPLSCEYCIKTFRFQNDYDIHQRKFHSGEYKYKCDSVCCPRIFKTKGAKLSHLRTVHDNNRPIACRVCSLSFSNSRSVKVHFAEKHSSEKPFICDICGLAFALKSKMNVHRRSKHLQTNRRKANLVPKRGTLTEELKRKADEEGQKQSRKKKIKVADISPPFGDLS